MEISVRIHNDAYQLGICHAAVCVIQNVKVLQGENTLEEDIARLMQQLTDSPEAILDRPEVRGFRELFAKMGYPKVVPAGERLIDSFRRRGFKKYNNLIDAYNV